MTILLIIGKALGLIVLAALLFLGFAEALDARMVGVPSPQELCAGQPITRCFWAII